MQAVLIYIIMLMTSMHFLFNYKVESLFAKSNVNTTLYDTSNHMLSARIWNKIRKLSDKSVSKSKAHQARLVVFKKLSEKEGLQQPQPPRAKVSSVMASVSSNFHAGRVVPTNDVDSH